jgi:hypothetical protein
VRAGPVVAVSTEGVAIVGSITTLIGALGGVLISRWFEWMRSREEQRLGRLRELETVLSDAALAVEEAVAAFGRRSTAPGPEERAETGADFNNKVTGVRRSRVQIAIRVDTAEKLVKSYQQAAAGVDDLSTIAYSLGARQLKDEPAKAEEAKVKRGEVDSALDEYLEHSRHYLALTLE